LLAIPDGTGGALVAWNANPNPAVGSFVVFRLSSPVLLGAIHVDDVGADGRYRFYDDEVPKGTHHYIVQARALGSTSTEFAEDFESASNGLRRAFIVDVGCEPGEIDKDRDGLCDRVELAFGTNLTASDSDGDGLTDGDELRGLRAKAFVPSDPLAMDTNQDGIGDLQAVEAGLNPTAAEVADPGFNWSIVLFGVGALAILLVLALAGRRLVARR
jgi:hypothetical protein